MSTFIAALRAALPSDWDEDGDGIADMDMDGGGVGVGLGVGVGVGDDEADQGRGRGKRVSLEDVLRGEAVRLKGGAAGVRIVRLCAEDLPLSPADRFRALVQVT